MPEKYVNKGGTTLNGAILAAATSLIVSSAMPYPTAGNFRITIDSEIMLVTAVSGSTFTVVRGMEGTTPAGHSNGATVTSLFTAGAFSQGIGDQAHDMTRVVDWSNVEILGASAAAGTGGNTNGATFIVSQAGLTIQGCLFGWSSFGSSFNIKCSLWDYAGAISGTVGTRLAVSNNIATTPSVIGVYYAPFTTPYVVGASAIGQTIAISSYETTGAKYTLNDNLGNPYKPRGASLQTPICGGRNFYWQNWNNWLATDGNPTNFATQENYVVEPVITISTTTTTTAFNMPALLNTVAIGVTSTTGMLPGQVLYLPGAGIFKVLVIQSATSVLVMSVDNSFFSAPAGRIIQPNTIVQW